VIKYKVYGIILILGLTLYLSYGLEDLCAAEEEKEPCPKPYIDTLNPKAAKPGEKIKIRGNRFSHEEGKVVFSPDVKAEILEWNYKRIWVDVPEGANTGFVFVSAVCGEDSNQVYFTVKGGEE
jgi:hypothetical protein